MQIIETSGFGMRAAVLRLRRSTTQLEFRLFPMLHLASANFYTEIQTRLHECDLILYEGVKAPQVWLLTLAYRISARSHRLGLTAQSDALDMGQFRDRLVHADLNSQEFRRGWRKVQFYLRFLLLGFAPLYGLYMYLFGTRDLIARYTEFNDLPSRDEVLMYDRDFELLDRALVGQRDARLVETIKQLVREPGQKPQTIGILYGARHMRAVIRYLTEKQGYHVADAEWVTVFEY